MHGGFIYLVTAAQAPRYKVIRTPAARPNLATAEVVLPESELVITSLLASRDAAPAPMVAGAPGAAAARIDVLLLYTPAARTRAGGGRRRHHRGLGRWRGRRGRLAPGHDRRQAMSRSLLNRER